MIEARIVHSNTLHPDLNRRIRCVSCDIKMGILTGLVFTSSLK